MSAPVEVALIGCSGSKLDHAAPARELYTGSLFKKSVAFAEARGLPWVVLSALHGVVQPDQLIEPYEKTLKGSSSSEREEWGHGVRIALLTRFPGTRFVFLAGQDYRAGISGLDVYEPLSGLGIGARLAWLDQKTKSANAEAVRAARRADGACEACGVALTGLSSSLCGSCKIAEDKAVEAQVLRAHELNPGEVESAPCDFCGLELECAVSELGQQRFEGDNTPARICATCATWALEQLKAKAPAVPA